MLVTDKPEDLPGTNALDDVEDPDAEESGDGVRTEMYLSGAHVFTLDDSPAGLQRFTLMCDVEVYEAGGVRFTGENGETQVPICKVRRIGDMYLPGTKRPPTKDEIASMKAEAEAKRAAEARAEAEKVQPPMFADDGEPHDPDAEPDTNDGPGTDDEAGRPEFSHGTK